MKNQTSTIRGLTGFIVRHAGVSYWLTALIKYLLFTIIIGGSVWAMYGNFTTHHQQIGYDKCKADQLAATTKNKEFADGVANNREQETEAGKQSHRETDTVTRKKYDKLKQEKANEKIIFEDILRNVTAHKNEDGSTNCANVDMPLELQRRPRSKTNNN